MDGVQANSHPNNARSASCMLCEAEASSTTPGPEPKRLRLASQQNQTSLGTPLISNQGSRFKPPEEVGQPVVLRSLERNSRNHLAMTWTLVRFPLGWPGYARWLHLNVGAERTSASGFQPSAVHRTPVLPQLAMHTGTASSEDGASFVVVAYYCQMDEMVKKHTNLPKSQRIPILHKLSNGNVYNA